LGALLFGAVGQRIGVPQTLVAAGVACGLITVIGWRVFPVPVLLATTLPAAGGEAQPV
jgi:hypothetical protein